MTVLAALADAPTAAIAVVAILLGLVFAARGPRDKREVGGGGSSDGEERAPMMVGSLPAAAAPDAEPGFVGPAGGVVGHGRIRLGVSEPLGGGESPAPEPAGAALPEPEAVVPEPVPVEPAFFASPPTIPEPLGGAVPLPDATPSPPPPPAPATEAPVAAEQAPSEQREPAWRVAARTANSAVRFRQGTIKLGGKPVDKREDQ